MAKLPAAQLIVWASLRPVPEKETGKPISQAPVKVKLAFAAVFDAGLNS